MVKNALKILVKSLLPLGGIFKILKVLGIFKPIYSISPSIYSYFSLLDSLTNNTAFPNLNKSYNLLIKFSCLCI